jgi:hypothetical protein
MEQLSLKLKLRMELLIRKDGSVLMIVSKDISIRLIRFLQYLLIWGIIIDIELATTYVALAYGR